MKAHAPEESFQDGSSKDSNTAVARRMLQVLVQFVMTAATLFAARGRLGWTWAWAYLGVGLGILTANVLVLPRELIAERGRSRRDARSWDRTLGSLSILPALGTFVVAGVDERLGWPPELVPLVNILGLVLYGLGQGLFTWAMASNKYFSTSVRIQTDRGHTVASGGPYRYVRHPGYVGYILSSLATAVALGSLWALVPSGLTAGIFVARTALEDRTLRAELEGYAAYANQVRYRLLPGIW